MLENLLYVYKRLIINNDYDYDYDNKSNIKFVFLKL